MDARREAERLRGCSTPGLRISSPARSAQAKACGYQTQAIFRLLDSSTPRLLDSQTFQTSPPLPLDFFKLFRTAPTLETLLERASRVKGGREQFYRALLESDLLIPGESDAGGLYIRPYELDGRVTIFIFSTQERLAGRLGAQTEAITLAGHILFSHLPPFDRLILDDGSKLSKEFTRSEVAALADRSILATGEWEQSGTSIVGQPKKYPVALMEELKKSLPLRPEIVAAYIAQIQDTPASEPRIVIALETAMDEGEFAALTARAAMLATAVGAADVGFVRLAGDAVGEYLRTETEAFYRQGM